MNNAFISIKDQKPNNGQICEIKTCIECLGQPIAKFFQYDNGGFEFIIERKGNPNISIYGVTHYRPARS